MNKKDFIILSALMNTMIEQGIDLNEHMPKDKKEKYAKMIETRFSKLNNNKKVKEELISTFLSYVQKIK